MNFVCSGPELLRTGEANPFLWLCEAKATRKIGNGKPDRASEKFQCYRISEGEGLAQIEIGKMEIGGWGFEYRDEEYEIQ